MITSLVLPEATGDGDLTYRVSALPAGLSFDSATRTLSGTPAQATAGAVEVTYTATDRDREAAVLSFAITVIAEEEKALSFAAGAAIAARTYTVGTAIVDLVLPEITDRDCHPAYSVSALPAGLCLIRPRGRWRVHLHKPLTVRSKLRTRRSMLIRAKAQRWSSPLKSIPRRRLLGLWPLG